METRQLVALLTLKIVRASCACRVQPPACIRPNECVAFGSRSGRIGGSTAAAVYKLEGVPAETEMEAVSVTPGNITRFVTNSQESVPFFANTHSAPVRTDYAMGHSSGNR